MPGHGHGLWQHVLSDAHQLGIWSYVVLAVLVMVEGPAMTLLGASAASLGLMDPWAVFISAGSGNLVGDVLWYTLGRQGKEDWVVRHGRWLGLNRDVITGFDRAVRENAAKIIFVAKVTLFFSVPALLATGLAHVRMRRWLPIDVLGECLWTGTLVTVGYYFSGYVQRLQKGFQYAAIAAFILMFPTVLYLIRRYARKWAHRHA